MGCTPTSAAATAVVWGLLVLSGSSNCAEERDSECEGNNDLGGQAHSLSPSAHTDAYGDSNTDTNNANSAVLELGQQYAPYKQQQKRRTPRTSLVRGEIAHPDEAKVPFDSLSVKFSQSNSDNRTPSGPDRNPAIQLYMELMSQFQTETSPSVSQLLATAVCHAYPRSKGAWDELAQTELQLLEPNVYAFIRANLISAVLKDEPEWFKQPSIDDDADRVKPKKSKKSKENGKKEKKKKKKKKKKNKKKMNAIIPGTLAAVDHATEVARVWYEDGAYDAAIAHAKRSLVKVKREWTSNAVNERDLERLIPLVCEWKASGSHSFPPMVHKNVAQAVKAAPSIWRPDQNMPGTMLSAFVTPIYVVNLIDEGAVDAEFNTRMATQAINGFEEFLKTPDAYDKKLKRLHMPTVLNDRFWSRQRSTKLTSIVPEVSEVMKHIIAGASRYLSEWDLEPAHRLSDWMLKQNADADFDWSTQGVPQAWFSIHGNYSDHLTHVHFASRLAVVYYPKVQEGDGRLVFEDPRGSRFDRNSADDCDPRRPDAQCTPFPVRFPPFAGNRFYHTPRPGDLVIFPGWLYHSVEQAPTNSGEYRVSLSFNVDGAWQATIP